MALSNLRISASRTNTTLSAACTWGATPDGGMNRVALNPDDKSVRDWFISETTRLGCTHKIDTMGNIFAVRPGTNASIPPIAIGSHLDTQPTGGKYDGILGVVCGLEVLEVLQEHAVQTYAPLAVVSWTNEEGARFPQAMVGSGVWAGEFSLEYAHGVRDDEGVSIKEALEKIGYLGTVGCGWEENPLLAHFEAHIEQAPLLDRAQKPAAVVTGVESIKWYYITVTGVESHAGSTPMESRKDALLAASEMIVAVNRAVTDQGLESGKLGARATVAWIQSSPQSLNTIAGKVKFGLDLRAVSDANMDIVVEQCQKDVNAVAEKLGLEYKMEHAWTSKAIRFNEAMVSCIRQSAQEEGCDMELVSHIGHDSVYTSRRIPTGMIFARCKDGVSHSPNEYARPEDCAASAQVLLGAYLRYDQHIREQHEK